MLKKSKWLLFASLLIAFAILLFIFNYSNKKKELVKDRSNSSKLTTRKNLDSLSIEEIRARYLNNPCYLALLKDPNMWEKGLTVKQAEALFSEANGVPALSRPIQGRFAPASTFKVVSMIKKFDFFLKRTVIND